MRQAPPRSNASEFLSHLAVERYVSATTQKQALCALLFFYKKVLGVDTLKLPLAQADRIPAGVCQKGALVVQCGRAAELALEDVRAAERAVHPRGLLKRWYIAALVDGSHSSWGGAVT